MTKELKNLVNTHGSIAGIESIGKTAGGHDLWVVTIAGNGGVPVDERPGMFIGANFEGDHLVGSELSLSVIRYLLDNYNTDEAVKKSIDEHVYYIMPRLNPDGAEKMFEDIKTGSKTNLSPYDGDNDGRIDEDGPEDLNGDGFITMMRVKDDKGLYMPGTDDARILKKADPSKGEEGIYSLYWEGTDNDNDGFINEDPVGGVDINRNFAHEYPYFKDDAGQHMVSENESIALMEWVIKHRNIAIMLTFGESDNLIIAPNAKGQLSPAKGIDLIGMADESYSEADKVGMVSTSRGMRFGGMFFRMGRNRQSQQTTQPSGRQRPVRKPETTINSADLEYFTSASDKYKELTGITKQPPLRNAAGAFFQYGYYQFGVLSLSTPGWGLGEGKPASGRGGRTAAAGEASAQRPSGSARTGMRPGGAFAASRAANTGNGIDSEFLSYLEKNNIMGFVDWQSFDHPTLGEVEIGGFTPYEVNNPPVSEVEKLGEAHGKFAVWLSGLYADVKIAKTEVVNHGGGLFRIKAEVENTGFLPTALAHGVASRSVKPTMVQIGVEPESIVSGNAKTSFFQSLDGSGTRLEYEWLIQGKSGDKVEIKVVSQKAGSDKVTLTLK